MDAQQVKWITADEAQEQFGFRPHAEMSGMQSKLQPMQTSLGTVLVRSFLLDSVEAEAEMRKAGKC